VADTDTTGIRTIAHAHQRIDDHEKRLIRTEVRQEEFTRRLEALEHVPDDLAEVKGDLKAIRASLEGSERVSNAREKGNTQLMEWLRALLFLVVGGLITAAYVAFR
jgi:hypothetical protein